jgi:ribosomal protein S18 acetylase RimI-like enzyme
VLVIREARSGEHDALVALDRASMRTFRDAGIDLPLEDERFEGDVLLVAEVDGAVVGLALVTRHDPWWHLDEICVHPDHGRQGIGTALVSELVARARDERVAGITLTTFRDVAFNGPWYARLGFVEVDERSHPWLAAARSDERSRGIDVAPRCAMALLLA